MYRLAVILFLTITLPARSQDRNFSVNAYRAFLENNATLTAEGLLSLHDAGTFESQAAVPPYRSTLFADSVDHVYELTTDERSLIDRHGFMVTERVAPHSFGEAFRDIYEADLPVFLSTDAILHAIHMSYDSILLTTELQVLIPKLDALLNRMHAELAALGDEYDDLPSLNAALSDADVYVTTARRLLSGSDVAPAFERSSAVIEDLEGMIAARQAAAYPLFAENCRQLDFSQFTPRGHYTRRDELAQYFQAMIWLGRTEIYLSEPTQPGGAVCSPSEADVVRQVRMSVLLAEAADRAGVPPLLEEIDSLIEMFVGESDNVRLPQLFELLDEVDISTASDVDPASFARFQEELASKPYSGQRILSQILSSNPLDPGRIEPAAAFMLLGQRFVIDSYVTGEVVFDRVKPMGAAPLRMLPSTLDVMFALGNDAAGQLLESELETYTYAPNLAALRYLIDRYDDAFWDQSMYTGWLNAIRTLRAPAGRSDLPPFMQTAAWWQEKLNTQLAAWAQLRHDNLLYAKQSYTGQPVCEYPYSYVEPIPDFYRAVRRFAENAAARFDTLAGSEGWSTSRITSYFHYLGAVSDTLTGIAEKELRRELLSEEETRFLRRMLSITRGCVEVLDGWYVQLYYQTSRVLETDLVVADVHTTPADESGNLVGWVLHAGTGPLNMAVMTADVPGTGPVAFVGPVMSYYEHVSTGFHRLTDEEWQSSYADEPSFRPEFVNLYLADANGDARPSSGHNLVMTNTAQEPELPEQELRIAPNYPNPFTERTIIGFTVPSRDAYSRIEATIYNLQGQSVRTLLRRELPGGAYSVQWDGRLENGLEAASGTYVFRLRVGEARAARPVTLIR